MELSALDRSTRVFPSSELILLINSLSSINRELGRHSVDVGFLKSRIGEQRQTLEPLLIKMHPQPLQPQ